MHQILLKTGENAKETLKMLQEWLLESKQWKQHKFLSGSSKLQSGNTSREHAECSGLPSMSKTYQKHGVKKHPKNRRIITICEAVGMLEISSGSVQRI